MNKLIFFFAAILLFASCMEPDSVEPQELVETEDIYFPGINNDEWETLEMDTLGWRTEHVNDLYNFLEENNTRAFIVLKDGKIVMEEYWGQTILGIGDFNAGSQWYWASAGKTITSSLVGIAQDDGLLDITDPSSMYLGEGWTSMSTEQENQITIRDQLTMSTGVDYEILNTGCTDPECLTYRADPGTQWFYHNATYTLLDGVIKNATGSDLNEYTDEKFQSTIGMNGEWINLNINNVYWSTARDMARFGLLIMNEGKWVDEQVIPSDYYNEMVNTSQDLNPAYGYLWWLNGKSSIVLPDLPTSFEGALASQAPSEIFAGLGKNGQFVDIYPSENIVVIRMGEAPEESLVPTSFHNDMWGLIMDVIE